MSKGADSTYADTTAKLLRLLAYVATHPGAGVPAIVRATGISRPSVYRLIGVLRTSHGAEIESDGGAYTVRSWGVLDPRAVLARSR